MSLLNMELYTLSCRSKRLLFDASPLDFAAAKALVYISSRPDNTDSISLGVVCGFFV